ncbi:MAG: TRCF domain-containing protein, partial [Chloroflexia bacterium]
RLSVIEQATELGAGFRIALKDLEIRGAGNLLGPEQSGQVAAIGLDLYTRLLATAVDKARVERGQQAKDERRKAARGEGAEEDWTVEDEIEASFPNIQTPRDPQLEEPPSVSLDLPLTAFLPEDYVPDAAVRLRMYQRMAASMSDSQIRDLRRELEDRFGALPEPTANLLEVLRLKGLAIAAGVESIRALPQEIVVHTPQEEPIPEGFRMMLQRKFRNYVKVSPHQVKLDRAKAGDRWIELLASILETLAEK